MNQQRNNRRRQTLDHQPTMDRLPPHSIEAEQGVLGCCLLDPVQATTECVQKLKQGKETFYDLRHQTIYETLTQLADQNITADLISTQQHLKDRQMLEQIGGLAYLSQLQDAVPSAANLPYYLDIIQEKHILRRLIRTCSDAVGKVLDCEGDTEALLDEVEREVLAIRTNQTTTQTSIKEYVNQSIGNIEAIFRRQGAIGGISTGLPDLDRESDGLHPAEYICIAAYPSIGKTSLAVNIVEAVAIEQDIPVGVFSAEMAGEQLTTRMICSQGRVNLRNVRDGLLSESDFPKMTTAASRISAAPIFIDDSSDMTIADVRARARRMKQQHGIKLFVVDYIQLITKPDAENRTTEIDQVSKGLKQMAKELDCCVIALSQLNDDGKLKGARAIGEDADGVWILSRQENDDENEGDGIPVTLTLRKQRNGVRNAKVPLTFLAPYTRFESASRIQHETETETRYKE